MKYYIIAGEASGDTYGSLIMKYILTLDKNASFRFWGGSKMKTYSSGQLKSIEETSFMGFWEVAKNAFAIREFFKFAKYSIDDYQPDVIIFIDYPGFNLRMLKWASLQGYKTVFYISPQLWAWKENRHKILKEYADEFLVILPFEKEFYTNLDTPCTFVGHPLLELIDESTRYSESIETIGLFPGSRAQEIKLHLPYMIELAQRLPQYKFTIAGLSHLKESVYDVDSIENVPNMNIIYDNPSDVMKGIQLAVVSSGTATLELALYNVPQVVIYKTNRLNYEIGKRLINTRFISLVNIIANKKIVSELIQEELTTDNLLDHINQLSQQPDTREQMLSDYTLLRRELGDGKTSKKVADIIFSLASD